MFDSPSAPPRLTARQQQILELIQTAIARTGAPPTRAEIAAELTRATGIVFTAAPSDIRLAGSIALDQVRADPRALEALLGVRVTPRGKGWVIAAE